MGRGKRRKKRGREIIRLGLGNKGEESVYLGSYINNVKVKLYWLHKLTQSMGSKGCVFVKCQGLPGYLLSLVPLVIFL